MGHFVRDNPMLLEALRAVRRLFRAESSRAATAAALTGIGLFYVWFLLMTVRSPENAAGLLLFFALLLVTLLAPASVYAAVAGERERATWEALILTRLTPGQILVGKLAWRLALVAGLLALFLPPILLSQATSQYGDALPARTLLGAFELLFAWGFLLLSFGLWVSVRSRRSVTAAAVIAGTLLFFLLLLPMLASLLGVLFEPAEWPYVFHPFLALAEMERVGGAAYRPLRPNWGTVQAMVYTVLAVLFACLSYRSLQTLEEPRRRDG